MSIERFIGENIINIRKQQNLSRKSLAEGICNESTLFRIEKGQHLPNIVTLNAISRKLNVPINFLLLNIDKDDYIYKMKALCREYTYKKEFESLEYLIEEADKYIEENRNENTLKGVWINEFDIFIKWHKAIIKAEKENEKELAIDSLRILLKEINHISELKISIYNSIGLIYLSTNQIDKANYVFSKAYSYLKNISFLEDKTLFSKVTYNFAVTLFENEYYEETLELCYKILYHNDSHYLIYSMGKINHLIGITYKKLNLPLDSLDYLEKSVNYFWLDKDIPNYLHSMETFIKTLVTVGYLTKAEMEVKRFEQFANNKTEDGFLCTVAESFKDYLIV